VVQSHALAPFFDAAQQKELKMYEVHQDNFERVEREKKRVAAIEQQCQDAIRDILKQEKLEARITFYPVKGR
jgi:hypothetical protein